MTKQLQRFAHVVSFFPVYQGSVPACEYLIVNGCQINAQDANHRSALHYAAMHNHIGEDLFLV